LPIRWRTSWHKRPAGWKNILLVLVIAPFFTSFLIRTLAWQTILSDNGPVVAFARSIHFTDLLQWTQLTNNDSLMNSRFAVIAGLTYNFLPFMILPLYANLERLDHNLVEAAGDLYATPLQTFWKVNLAALAARGRGRHLADLHPRSR